MAIKIKSILLVLILFTANNIQAQGLIGTGLSYHPLSKTRGINARVGATNDKTPFL